MQKTSKLGLNKPDLTDYVSIADLNENADILDEALGGLQNGSTVIEELQTESKELAGAINELVNKTKLPEAPINTEVISLKQKLADLERKIGDLDGLLQEEEKADLVALIGSIKQQLTTHLADNEKHITKEERTNWNEKAPGYHTHTISQVTGLQNALDSKIASNLINKPSGVAGLDGSGKLLESFMPTGTTKTISGSFVGDGTTGRLINIGATPKLVILLLKSKNTSIGNMFSIFNSLMNFHAEHYATTLSTHYEGARVVENGFNLNGAAYHNINGDIYHYYAFL